MIRDQRPNIMMIQENKMKKDSLGKIKFSNMMSVEASNLEGVSGHLLILFYSITNILELNQNIMMVIFSSVEFIIYNPMKVGFC